jgi:hypothetical protein
MLVYHPAFDAYHCVFRLLAILEDGRQLENDRLKILDFILCFPAVVADFKLPQKAMAIRRPAKLADNAYRTPLNPKATFGTLMRSQEGALACLAAANFIVPNSLRNGVAVRTSVVLPDELLRQCAKLREREDLFFKKIYPALLDMPLLGHDGLKARSGLLEHRYDTVQA